MIGSKKLKKNIKSVYDVKTYAKFNWINEVSNIRLLRRVK